MPESGRGRGRVPRRAGCRATASLASTDRGRFRSRLPGFPLLPPSQVPSTLASTSREAAFPPRECTYTRGDCDRAAIEADARMVVREHRVKARHGGGLSPAAGGHRVTPSATEKTSRPAASAPPLPEIDELSGIRLPTMADVTRAREVIARYLRPTPLLSTPALDELLGFQAFLKCENLQPVGAFKVRGGLFLISDLSPRERARGVVTASTGNHGQSIAYSAASSAPRQRSGCRKRPSAQGRLDAAARRRGPLRRPRLRRQPRKRRAGCRGTERAPLSPPVRTIGV